jgi:acetyltransferase
MNLTNVHNLDRIFKPKRIALLGVTENPKGVGATVLHNLVGAGYRGVVYPVNPSLEAVQGVACYPDVAHLPRTPDLAVVCTPPHLVPGIVRECGQAGILGLVIISAGFREVGAAGRALEEQLLAEARRFDGMRLIGPNCLGLIVPGLSLNLTFAIGTPKAGHVAFISQSGALCTSVLDWAIGQGIGFSHFVSIGNMLDVDFGDLIDYFGEDEQTESMILYIESLKNARRFMTAARAFARQKPIVAYKAGRFPESAQAAASHTGAMASEDAVYQAAFQRAGIARVFEIGEIFNVAELIGRQKTPAGPRLAIVTNAGGPGVMATDALIAQAGELARLGAPTLAQLDEDLPPFWSHGNPIDVLGDAPPKRYAKAAAAALRDPGVDAVLAILTPQAMTNPTSTARQLAELAGTSEKPILGAWLGGASMREGVRLLGAAGIPSFQTPEAAVGAFMTLVDYARNLETLYETPRDIPVTFPLARREVRERFLSFVPESGDILSERASKRLLAAYGIPTALPEEAHTEDEAAAVAERLGYPAVLKILSPDITHKTDVGGVALDLGDEAAIRAAYGRIVAAARARRPDARIDGVTVQRMVRGRDAVELIVGAKQDPVFGTVILVGAGGVTAELYHDRALGLPPLNERLARRMLESLRSWPLLNGYRGRTQVNLDSLIEVLMRFSYLVADYPEIAELDVNPLLVTAEGAIALDARVVLDRAAIGRPPGRAYAHLALRPYPEEYVREASLKDGARLTLRPIRPEDEPRWLGLLASCSRETIYSRFRYLFDFRSHHAAVRYCFNDYDREIAIVCETMEDGVRAIVGVGRLVADPDHESVEYAILVSDAWQNRGLGGVLTDYCMAIAAGWGLKRVVAVTTADNVRMLALFEERGFTIRPGDEGLVQVDRELTGAAPPPPPGV